MNSKARNEGRKGIENRLKRELSYYPTSAFHSLDDLRCFFTLSSVSLNRQVGQLLPCFSHSMAQLTWKT